MREFADLLDLMGQARGKLPKVGDERPLFRAIDRKKRNRVFSADEIIGYSPTSDSNPLWRKAVVPHASVMENGFIENGNFSSLGPG